MSLYYVEMRAGVVVVANSRDQAFSVANAITPAPRPEADSATEIVDLHNLSTLDLAWDGRDIPHGGDGETMIRDLLPLDDD